MALMHRSLPTEQIVCEGCGLGVDTRAFARAGGGTKCAMVGEHFFLPGTEFVRKLAKSSITLM